MHKKKLIKIVERVIGDPENPSVCEIDTLASFNLHEIKPSEKEKIGQFKIKRENKDGYYSSIKAFEVHNEVVYYLEDGKWEPVLYHSLYEYEKDFDHGKEWEGYSKPLIPFVYFEPKNRIYFIEDESGSLYCSLDKKRWFLQLLAPKKRPYFGKIDKIVKIAISYEE
ncbi:MAG: hypothetical protein FK734_12790 [Asgard group archaeon]|nr:hypothetical protein [Asgard group archaeon]